MSGIYGNILENINCNNSLIFSCFAGVGKNYAIRKLVNDGYKVFSIEKDYSFKELYPDRKNDYPNHIRQLCKQYDVLFIPYFLGMYNECFKDKSDINFTIIYPDKKLKNEYFKRFKSLGFSKSEMKNFYDNFDNMIIDIEKSKCDKIKLKSKDDYCLYYIYEYLEKISPLTILQKIN